MKLQRTIWSVIAAFWLSSSAHGDGDSGAGFPSNYFVRVWQAGDDGLPENNITAVVQTRDGYLWLGTRDGLARFDGVHFTAFNASTTPAMHSSHVSCLFEADDGTLWIGHADGEVITLKDGRFSALKAPERWRSGKISFICSDAAGDIWLLNQYGELARARDGLMIPWASSQTVHLLAMTRDQQGECWVQRDTDVSLLAHGELKSIFGEPSTNRYVQGICAAHDGGLWVMMGTHIMKWKSQKWVEDHEAAPWDRVPSQTISETRDERLAVATADHGFFLGSPAEGFRQFWRKTGFPSDWVNALCEDREGNLWAGTGNGGLAMLRAVNVKTIGPPDQWQGRAVLGIAAGKDGSLWAGTEGAGLYRFFGRDWTHFDAASGLMNYYVWSVAPDAPRGCWAGTWGAGVFEQGGGRFEPSAELGSLYVGAICEARNGGMFIGTIEGLLSFEAGQLHWLARKPQWSSPDVRAICEGSDGVIWFGMSGGGLGCIHHGQSVQFRTSDGLSSDFVQCLHLAGDGSLWIGTMGGGLNRLKDGRFAVVTKKQGLLDDIICDIQDDERGYFWISSHGGIMRVSQKELENSADGDKRKLHCLALGLSDGLPALECSGGFQPAGCRTADGNLWFPTAKGLVGIDPTVIRTNLLPPPVAIEEVRVDDEPATNIGASLVQIEPGRHRLDFEYAGLSFVAPEKVRFKYRLDPLDQEWFDAAAKRVANYSYIPPGRYVFRVTACNNDGVWNETGAAVAFKILPYFWQTGWFRVLVELCVALVVGGSVLMGMRRRMRRQVERLEREKAIERERTRIAKDIHDDLGASLTRITMLSQSARNELDNAPQAAARVEQICTTSRDLTRAMDEIVWAVNPQHDSLDSLAIYLGKFAQDYLRAAGIRCRLNMPEDLPPWPVKAEARHNLFLAFKEALHNVVKHSDGKEVRVILALRTKAIVLSVEDNGRGFTPGLPTSGGAGGPGRIEAGHGIVNMKLRLAEIHGTCEIQSAPESGTAVQFDLPV